MTAGVPLPMPTPKKKISIAVPVISQGTAMGGNKSACNSRFPGKSCRHSASVAMVPRTVAIPATTTAIQTDRQAADRISAFVNRRSYHSVEKRNGRA